MTACKTARTPSTETVMDMVERLEDYLYWLRPGVRERATPSGPRLLASIEALRAAGLDFPIRETKGWGEVFLSAIRAIVNDLWRYYPGTAEPDEESRQFLADQLRFVRDGLYFAMGREFDHLAPIVVTESGLARLLGKKVGDRVVPLSKTRLFARLAKQGRIRVEPAEPSARSRFHRVWFLFPGEHQRRFTAWSKR